MPNLVQLRARLRPRAGRIHAVGRVTVAVLHAGRGVVAGLAGYAIDPLQVQSIILVASGLYSALALFYDNVSRKPRVPTPEELNKLLSSTEIVALINLRKAKIAAEKELVAK